MTLRPELSDQVLQNIIPSFKAKVSSLDRPSQTVQGLTCAPKARPQNKSNVAIGPWRPSVPSRTRFWTRALLT